MNPALENFTFEDCYEILKKNFMDNTVESYEFCPFEEKMGYLGDHCYLKINYRDCNQTKTVKFFTKAMSVVESQKNFAMETGAFHKECGMFNNLVPKFLENNIHAIKECIPTCYLVSDMNYLIFEDLALQGYKTMSQRESMSLECVKSCLKTLAKFHASSLLLEERIEEKSGQKYRLPENFPNIFNETFFSDLNCSINMIKGAKTGARAIIDIFGDPTNIDVELFKQLACNVLDELRKIVKPSSVFRNAICHGDLWAFNAMVKFEEGTPTHCRIVDFQSYRYGPPAQDFLAFIYLSTDRQFRQQHMEEVTSFYYQQMAEVFDQYDISIKKILPYDEFENSCAYYKLFSIVQSVNHFPVIMMPPDVSKRLYAIPGALQKMIFEDRGPVIRELCESDLVYRSRMLECITDLKDVFMEKGLLELSS